jgi:hypothetical protein
VVLADEIEAVYSNPGPGDGTVASRAHDLNNPTSDHRPHPYSGPGIVRAIDAGEYVEDQAWHIAETIRVNHDPRIKYVIHEGRLFSSYPKPGYPEYTWRPYNGANPHDHHVHISTLPDADDDTTAWGLTLEEDTVFLPIREGDGIGARAFKRSDVAAIQAMLNRAYNAGVTEDGKYGPQMKAAVKTHTGSPDGESFYGSLFDDLIWAIAQKVSGGGGLSAADVKAIINDSTIAAPL